MAMTLADFTCSGLILPEVQGQDGAAVIRELSDRLAAEHRIPDALAFYQAVLQRELIVSTEMEAGVAFPHARVSGVQDLSFALARSQLPLRWGPHGSGRVRCVFLMAVPASDPTPYLSLISGLVRLVKSSEAMARLQAAPHALAMLEVLDEIELKSFTSPRPGSSPARPPA